MAGLATGTATGSMLHDDHLLRVPLGRTANTATLLSKSALAWTNNRLPSLLLEPLPK